MWPCLCRVGLAHCHCQDATRPRKDQYVGLGLTASGAESVNLA